MVITERDASDLADRTMRLSSGTQLPQFVPHFSALCSDARRSVLLPVAPYKYSSIAVSVTVRQVHTSLPRGAPQLIPDLLGCFAALLLFAPAVEAVRKMMAAKSKDAAK